MYLTEVIWEPDGPTSTEKLVRCVVMHCRMLLSTSCAVMPSVDHPPLIEIKKIITLIFLLATWTIYTHACAIAHKSCITNFSMSS